MSKYFCFKIIHINFFVLLSFPFFSVPLGWNSLLLMLAYWHLQKNKSDKFLIKNSLPSIFALLTLFQKTLILGQRKWYENLKILVILLQT